MFVIKVDKNIAKICRKEPMTSGSSKAYLVQFYFSPEWDDLKKVAVFHVEGLTVDVLLDRTNRCFIPWEVLTTPKVCIDIGVYGTYTDDVSLPTVWVRTDKILEGVKVGVDAQLPSPSLYDQLLEQSKKVDNLSEYINSLKFGHGLAKDDENVVSVNMYDDDKMDTTLPVSAAMLQTAVGDIEVLLQVI